MNTDNNDRQEDSWNDLADIWAGGSDGDGLAPDHADRIERQVRWLQLRSKLVLAVECVVSLLGVVAGSYFVINNEGYPDVVMGSFAILFSLAAITFSTLVRRTAWGRPGDAPLAHLEALLVHAQTGVKLSRLNDYLCAAALAFIGVVFWADSQQAPENEATSPLVIAVLLFLIAAFVIGQVYGRKKLREIERLTQLRKDLAGANPSTTEMSG